MCLPVYHHTYLWVQAVKVNMWWQLQAAQDKAQAWKQVTVRQIRLIRPTLNHL